MVAATKLAAQSIGLEWSEKNYLLLRRGPYVVAAGLDESIGGAPRVLNGRFVNLFDSELRVLDQVTLASGSRQFLLDLDVAHSRKPHLLASACRAVPGTETSGQLNFTVEGVAETPAVMLMETPKEPKAVTLAGKALTTFEYSDKEHLLWIHFENTAAPRDLTVQF